MKKNLYIAVWMGMALAGALVSCEQLEDTYSEYLSGGEIIYAPKADTVYFRSGKERVALNYVVTNSPGLKDMCVTWNEGKGKQTFPLHLENGNGEGVFYIEGLLEDSYAFEVTMMDNHGHASLVTEAFSRAYGDLYSSALTLRDAISLQATEEGGVVRWMPSSAGFLYNEIKFMNNNNEEVSVISETDEPETVLPDIKGGTGIRYRSAYRPDEDCIDVFYTDWGDSEREGMTLPHLYKTEQAGGDRLRWRTVLCESNQSGDGGGPDAMLDGNAGSYWHSGYNENRVACPFAIIFDMQESRWLSSVGLMQRNGGYNYRMTGVDVYVGENKDGSEWTLAARTSLVASDDMQWFDLNVEKQIKGRYLKLVVTHTHDNDDGVTALAEVDVKYVTAVDGVPVE